jgi:ketosteroid isomerase-like protein
MQPSESAARTLSWLDGDRQSRGMELGNLRINQLSDKGWTFYQAHLDALDRYDTDQFAMFLADDVSVQFNNEEALTGRQAAVQGLGGFWASIQSMGYSLPQEPLNIYGTDHAYVLEALNHYDSADRGRVTVRAVAFTDRDADGKVSSIRVYQDLSALYAQGSD